MNFASVFYVLLYVINLRSFFNAAYAPIDVSWDFNNNEIISGWGNGTAEQMNMEVKVENGNLKCSIIGFHPVLESPSLFLTITRRHYIIIRALYSGIATKARILLRSGPSPSPNNQLLLSKSYWESRQPTIVINQSPANSTLYASGNIVDGDGHSYYLSTTSIAAFVVLDLGDNRWITRLRMLPLGDNRSPKRCLLQRSLTSGVGPFETVSKFTINIPSNGTEIDSNHTINEQSITGFNGYARYWKVIFLDNYGGHGIGIRDLYLEGYDESVTLIPFELNNTIGYNDYYLPIHSYLSGVLLRIRLEIIYPSNVQVEPINRGKRFREGLFIDYIRVARAPEIWRVRGCLDKYYIDPNYLNPNYNVTTRIELINGNLPIRSFVKNNLTLQYATTYDCPNQGGVPIIIEGINFGLNAKVVIGGNICPIQSNNFFETDGRLQIIVCMLPANDNINNSSNRKIVRVENNDQPLLFHEVPSLDYRVAPPVIENFKITNIGATRMDMVWSPPGDEFSHMTVTGYKILWFHPLYPSRISNLTVGNVTTTSIRGLEPATEYVFAIAAMSEGSHNAKLPTDLYGRRSPTPDAMLSAFSIYTNITATLLFDFDFGIFGANMTLNNSGSTYSNSLGPTGQYGSEGNYGLVLVGSANLENCNVSSTCCDGYNATIGVASCGNYRSVCAVLPANMLAYPFVIDGVTRRGVPTNLPYSNGAPAEIQIVTLAELIANKGADAPSSACGPALRLTSSTARQSGASWYQRKVDVREGFDTTFTFRISNPSQKCDRLDDVNTYCRSRGADGIAFVIQNVANDALGNAGSGIGYDGIFNSLAVELDTYHNYDQMDYYENHISIMTQGFRYNITANHSRSLANSNKIPDLTDGNHTIRIKYDPNFDENAVPHPSFQTNGFTTWFMNNADFHNGGEGDWGVGVGLFYVYIDDMYSPIITTPMNLGATLKLDNGRAYVGLTAATGAEYWQAHDILGWQFKSLFIDESYNPPILVNNQGAYECVNETECVHQVDYDHYMRYNNVWGKGYDDTEGWQTGKEGYCAFC
eukprot:gene6359-8759_t